VSVPSVRFDDLVAGSALAMAGYRGAVEARTDEEVVPALAEVERAAAAGWFAAGFVAYDAAPGFDPALAVPGRRVGTRRRVPLVWFGIFERAEEVAPLVEGRHEVPELRWHLDSTFAAFEQKLAAVKAAIAAGSTYQVNLTERLRAPFTGDPGELYAGLVLAQRGRYGAYVDCGDLVVASASPELFFEWFGDKVTTRPMKGTARRGRWAQEDAAVARALVCSAKDRAENVMITDLLRNDVGRLAQWGTVQVPALCELERYETVWQLTSTVTATLRPGTGLVDIMRALFPSGSVTGAPKHRTMALIAELESQPRGVYCGALGLVAPPNAPGGLRARFRVAIRTAVIDLVAQEVSYGTGGGVTWASHAAAEWDELHAKTAVVFDARRSSSFQLLETMAYEPVGGLRHLAAHLDRLSASADYFGFRFDRRRVTAALDDALGDVAVARRVRLALSRDGTVAVEVAEPPPAPAGPVRLAIDSEPVDTTGPWPFHKTTHRGPYERRAARHPEADDVVLVNERGEVTETTVANLAVDLGGRWWTPPLSSGCLPGVERGRLLSAGVLAERVLTPADLLAARGLALVSSLRGWRPAVVDARYAGAGGASFA